MNTLCYLGDGVYAEFESGLIKLTSESGTDAIYLEPETFDALVRYVMAGPKAKDKTVI